MISALFDTLQILLVVLGIGGVIFVHELGHFLAARMCGVCVEVFSLGFGPRLFGWRRGTTTYQVAGIPLGGYVKMKGDDGVFRDPRPDADDLQSKTVGQRFFIYSAGVIMNVLLGIVLFPLIFLIGVPLRPPVIGEIMPGGPAWQAGLDSRAEVLSVQGEEVFDWEHVHTAIAFSGGGEVELVLRDPGAEETRKVSLPTITGPFAGLPDIGIGPPADFEDRVEVVPDSPAALAGLESGDRVLALEGGVPGFGVLDQLELAQGQGETVYLSVDGPAGPRRIELAPERSEGPPRLGIEPRHHRVVGLRPNPTLEAVGLREGDLLLSIGTEEILRLGDFERALSALEGPLVARVQRGAEELVLEGPSIAPGTGLALAGDLALSIDAESTVIIVRADHAGARGGLRDGDRVVRIDDEPVSSWEEISARVGAAGEEGRPTRLEVMRRAAPGEPERSHVFTLTLEPAPIWSYGILRRPATYVFRTSGPVESIRAGLLCSWRYAQEVWASLTRMVSSELSLDQLGGIVTIGMVSYDWAGQGLTKLLYFLCILSINLAILNVLPIPVLDGGHLFFLLVEKVKGSPVSERVLGYSQMVGLVLILSLMVYVTFNDIQRWFF